MKLKPDIVRDILLTVEDECDFDNRFVYDVEKEIPDRLKQYSVNEIAYHVRQCELAELILGVEILEGGEDIIIADLRRHSIGLYGIINQLEIYILGN